MLDAGLAKVHVHIGIEARRDDGSGGIEHSGIRIVQAGSYRFDAAVADQDVGESIATRGRIDDAPAGDQK